MRNIHAGKSIRRVAVGMLAVAAFLVPAPLATAARADPAGRDDRPPVIRLPGATGAEGIAAGDGSTFFAGDLLNGNIFRGDIDKGKAKLFITAPEGRAAAGMKVDRENGLLFVAGGATGQAYVYDLETKKTVTVYDLAPAGASFINDVTVTHDGAWFTNSRAGELYRIPIGRDGKPGAARTLALEAPAGTVGEGFNLNGIAAAKDGHRLIVAHTGNGALYSVDPDDGSNRLIGVTDSSGAPVTLANVDGIILRDNTLWAVQNFTNQVSRIELNGSLRSGEVQEVITSGNFDVPTTAALFGNTLALVNAKFSTPAATSFEVVLVRACNGG
ncbi:SMP-30/gluconolactonase/LRE family protein [Arthrobacter sp. PsM3]|uniref:SMP-30/gluconolactonase/LRE family protein n=1 Tax=Arthrobacter sp. PsM3 TaxID=3030531 RepID=UPI00263B25EC|nr:SMP-30/gluconolactonase/LRE family protein [Arthrobacter sp. PsM3]MDN4644591.1 SMP-30/gluconolactonase/LRE family protein [Arthrobacter sp. PsM3]